MKYKLHRGDCLEEMTQIDDGSIDTIIADLPYGTTACNWDSVIPFEPMWTQFKRVIKKRGAVVLFGSQPFTSQLINSNLPWFKYSLVWDKRLAGNFLNANRMPLMIHEDVPIFGKHQTTYNPQMIKGQMRGKGSKTKSNAGNGANAYGKYAPSYKKNDLYYPRSIVYKSNGDRTNGDNGLHPTQKPVALLEYLIKTYTNPGETVLDCTMGSGTTGVAAMKTGRRFVGIELDPTYFEIAQTRIKNAAGDFTETKKEQASGQLNMFDAITKK